LHFGHCTFPCCSSFIFFLCYFRSPDLSCKPQYLEWSFCQTRDILDDAQTLSNLCTVTLTALRNRAPNMGAWYVFPTSSLLLILGWSIRSVKWQVHQIVSFQRSVLAAEQNADVKVIASLRNTLLLVLPQWKEVCDQLFMRCFSRVRTLPNYDKTLTRGVTIGGSSSVAGGCDGGRMVAGVLAAR